MQPIPPHESTQALRLHLLFLASLAPAVAVVTYAEQLTRGAWDPTVALGVLSGVALWGWVVFGGGT